MSPRAEDARRATPPGAPERAAASLAYFGNRLQAHDRTPTVIDSLAELLRGDFHVVTASDQHNQALRLLDMVRVLWRERRCDFVLIDTYSTRAFHYAVILGALCRRLGIRYVPIVHGGALAERLARSPRRSRRLFSGAWAIVAPSPYLQAVFARHGHPAKVIPNPLALERYDFAERPRPRARLLWVRALDRLYDPEMAVRVLARLDQRHPDATLCMVGPDKDGSAERVRALADRMGVAARLRMTGRLEPEAWRRLSRDYDVFLNTTTVDNAPVSVVEAMALGLPVVSTAVGGIPYLIEDGVDGLLVPAGDDAAMAASVERLIERPDVALSVSRAARRKADDFDAERVRQAWRRLLLGRATESAP